MRARLAQPRAAATDFPDPEVPADQPVDVDAAGDHIAAVLIGRQRRVLGVGEGLEHLGGDQRQGAARDTGGEGAQAVDVAVAFEPAPRVGARGLHLPDGSLGARTQADRLDHSRVGDRGRCQRQRERDIEGSDPKQSSITHPPWTATLVGSHAMPDGTPNITTVGLRVPGSLRPGRVGTGPPAGWGGDTAGP